MNASSKNFLKGIATVILIAVNTFALLVFSFLGAVGVCVSIFGLDAPKSSVIDGGNVLPIFSIVIGLIIAVPIMKLISQTKQSRWQVTFQSLFFLFLYLAGGIAFICGLAISVAMLGLFLEKDLEILKAVSQITSLLLALGYYFYFKKVIKPNALKI